MSSKVNAIPDLGFLLLANERMKTLLKVPLNSS